MSLKTSTIAALTFLGGPSLLGFSGLLPATISGGGGVTSASMVDPYTPTDGTWNVTGAITASSTVTGGDFRSGGMNINVNSYRLQVPSHNSWIQLNPSTVTTEPHVLLSSVTDASAQEAWRIAAAADLTTAGRKIASFGDNAVTSYAEKAAFLYDGAQLHTPAALALSGAHTALPVGGIVEVTLTGAQTWTITETGATNGEMHTICNLDTTPDVLTMDHVAGQVLLVGGADVALGQNDCLSVYYSTAASAWLQYADTANN